MELSILVVLESLKYAIGMRVGCLPADLFDVMCLCGLTPDRLTFYRDHVGCAVMISIANCQNAIAEGNS